MLNVLVYIAQITAGIEVLDAYMAKQPEARRWDWRAAIFLPTFDLLCGRNCVLGQQLDDDHDLCAPEDRWYDMVRYIMGDQQPGHDAAHHWCRQHGFAGPYMTYGDQGMTMLAREKVWADLQSMWAEYLVHGDHNA